MASYVTIEKSYLETLLRRAQFHVSSADLHTPIHLDTVTITKSDHEQLLRSSREYDNLKRNLRNGGVSQADIDTLINAQQASQGQTSTSEDSTSTYAPPAAPSENSQQLPAPFPPPNTQNGSGTTTYDHNHTRSHRPLADITNHQDTFECDENSFPSDEREDCVFPDNTQFRTENGQARNTENRTIAIRNLPERAVHRDVVAAIRGGALVDVFLRARERLASVSFVDGNAAQEFMAYAKHEHIYILGRLVEVSWAERQFYIPNHVSHKLANGASRNLVVRGVNPNITEARIREDLDHIHNLIVISVTFHGGDAYISTNSVHNALFARTCMMSRLTYRGMRIEHYPDECAAPLPRTRPLQPKKENRVPSKKLDPTANRFQMLTLDGSGEVSEDEEDGMAGLSGGIKWADAGIAV